MYLKKMSASLLYKRKQYDIKHIHVQHSVQIIFKGYLIEGPFTACYTCM